MLKKKKISQVDKFLDKTIYGQYCHIAHDKFILLTFFWAKMNILQSNLQATCIQHEYLKKNNFKIKLQAVCHGIAQLFFLIYVILAKRIGLINAVCDIKL
jgi:hypothetical protein